MPNAPALRLPDAVNKDYSFYDIQAHGVWGLIGDLQMPFHDRTTVELFVDRCVKEDVKGVILNGDIADFHQISRFDKRAGDPSYAEEIESVRGFLAWLRYKLGNKKRIVFKEGNHEERLYSYLYRKCPELWDLEELTLASLLHFSKHGIEHVADKRVIKFGEHLHIIHGHEYAFSIQNPVNPARGLFLRSKAIALTNHFHQTSEHTEPTLAGVQLACWSVGCACGLRPLYMPLNKWNNGFAMLEANPLVVRNYRVIAGKVV